MWSYCVFLLPLRLGLSKLALFHLLLSVCVEPPLSLSSSLAHRLGSGSGIVHMQRKEFGSDTLLGHYSSSWPWNNRLAVARGSVERMRSSDSTSTETKQWVILCHPGFFWSSNLTHTSRLVHHLLQPLDVLPKYLTSYLNSICQWINIPAYTCALLSCWSKKLSLTGPISLRLCT